MSTPANNPGGQRPRANENNRSPMQIHEQYFDSFIDKIVDLSPTELVLFTYSPDVHKVDALGGINDSIRFHKVNTEQFIQGIARPDGCSNFEIHTLVFAHLNSGQIDIELSALKHWLGVANQHQFIYHIVAPSTHPVKLFYQDNLIHFENNDELLSYVKSIYSNPHNADEKAAKDIVTLVLNDTEELLESDQLDLEKIETWEKKSEPIIDNLLDNKNLVKNFRNLQLFKDLKNLIFILTYLKMIINTHSKSYVLQTTIEAKERLNKFKNAYHK